MHAAQRALCPADKQQTRAAVCPAKTTVEVPLLPNELWYRILNAADDRGHPMLDARFRFVARLVCRTWNDLVSRPSARDAEHIARAQEIRCCTARPDMIAAGRIVSVSAVARLMASTVAARHTACLSSSTIWILSFLQRTLLPKFTPNGVSHMIVASIASGVAALRDSVMRCLADADSLRALVRCILRDATGPTEWSFMSEPGPHPAPREPASVGAAAAAMPQMTEQDSDSERDETSPGSIAKRKSVTAANRGLDFKECDAMACRVVNLLLATRSGDRLLERAFGSCLSAQDAEGALAVAHQMQTYGLHRAWLCAVQKGVERGCAGTLLVAADCMRTLCGAQGPGPREAMTSYAHIWRLISEHGSVELAGLVLSRLVSACPSDVEEGTLRGDMIRVMRRHLRHARVRLRVPAAAAAAKPVMECTVDKREEGKADGKWYAYLFNYAVRHSEIAMVSWVVDRYTDAHEGRFGPMPIDAMAHRMFVRHRYTCFARWLHDRGFRATKDSIGRMAWGARTATPKSHARALAVQLAAVIRDWPREALDVARGHMLIDFFQGRKIANVDTHTRNRTALAVAPYIIKGTVQPHGLWHRESIRMRSCVRHVRARIQSHERKSDSDDGDARARCITEPADDAHDRQRSVIAWTFSFMFNLCVRARRLGLLPDDLLPMDTSDADSTIDSLPPLARFARALHRTKSNAALWRPWIGDVQPLAAKHVVTLQRCAALPVYRSTDDARDDEAGQWSTCIQMAVDMMCRAGLFETP